MAILAALGAAAAHAESAKPDPRWSEAGRRHILALTDQLEKRPLAGDAKRIRAEVMRWWVEVPSLEVHWCTSLFMEGTNEKVMPIVVAQGLYGAGAFLIQSGDEQPSTADAAMAGARSALESYRNAVKADPSYGDPFFDQLVADPKRLKSYLDEKVTRCRNAEQNKKAVK